MIKKKTPYKIQSSSLHLYEETLKPFPLMAETTQRCLLFSLHRKHFLDSLRTAITGVRTGKEERELFLQVTQYTGKALEVRCLGQKPLVIHGSLNLNELITKIKIQFPQSYISRVS